MARKAVTADAQTAVLLKSRRRCCICYGLHRDLGIKQGQIAHIDQDSSNSEEENLGFFCLPHHDEYDGKRKQSKNLTPQEIKAFRAELYAANEVAFAVPSPPLTTPASAAVAGHYIGVEERSADFRLTPIPLSTNSFHVSGATIFPGDPHQLLPTVGEVDFVAELREGSLVFSGGDYRLILHFDGDRLTVTQEGDDGRARFQGTYEKARSVQLGGFHGAAQTSFHPVAGKKREE